MISTLSEVRERLAAAGLNPDEVEALVRAALAEDLRGGEDVTSVATMTDDAVTADLVVRASDGIVAGVAVAELALALTVADVELQPRVDDGDQVRRGDVVLTVTGSGRGLLTAERT
ncbi:MAG TPA: nicotinate-nucleotide diphosphorylase (carboxylating), partial [Nocardioidaceae bacterium]|nr:nicotinate-nucleotide diphosphorylase (carboxylating) [Nocardioidaceae bacterium]